MTHASAATFDFRGGPLGQDIFFQFFQHILINIRKNNNNFRYSFNCFKFFQVTPPPFTLKILNPPED